MLAFIISLLLPVNILSFKLGLGIRKEFYRPFYVTIIFITVLQYNIYYWKKSNCILLSNAI